MSAHALFNFNYVLNILLNIVRTNRACAHTKFYIGSWLSWQTEADVIHLMVAISRFSLHFQQLPSLYTKVFFVVLLFGMLHVRKTNETQQTKRSAKDECLTETKG